MIENKSGYVRNMFGRIAERYDLMNRIMTFGQDIRWRDELIHRANLANGMRILDLGAGTGDIASTVQRECPQCQIVAGDFTITMMRTGKQQPGKAGIAWCGSDALALPFPDETFDIVLSGFLFRNVDNIQRALLEQFRVLKPGGKSLTLDTTPAPTGMIRPVVLFYEQQIIPLVGKLITGDAAAYEYLPNSTAEFLPVERFAAAFALAGYQEIGFVQKMMGTVAIHWGSKPAST